MKFIIKSISKLKLNLFENKLVYLHNDKLEVKVKLPLKIVITSDDAVIYTNKKECFIDYSPKTLGYYWINNNKCLRTNKGLIFKTVSKKDAVQTRLSKNKTITHQNINWQKSIKPINQKEYTFKKATNQKAILNKSKNNKWYLKIDNKKVNILISEFNFSYEYDSETGFELINNTITYYDKLLLNVDIKSFKVLNHNYAIDKNTAFCGNDVLPDADITTFRVLTHNLAKDKNQVYYFSNILKHADSESLQLFNNPNSLYFKDKNYIFEGGTIIIGADLNTFKTVGEIFGIDKNYVYRYSKRLNYIDTETFKIINNYYFKDKNYIYLNTYIKTKICKNDKSFQDLGNGYYILKNSIYHHGFDNGNENKKISNTTKNFKTLPFQWAKNNTKLFYNGKEIYKGDTSTVKVFDDAFHVIINNKVFFYGDEYSIVKEIVNVDIATFTIFSLGFSKDKNHLYFMGKIIENGLPKSFKQLNKNYFKDKNNIYIIEEWNSDYTLTHIKNIKTSTIEILGHGYFKNKKEVYFGKNKILGANPADFKILKKSCYRYSCDKNSVYYLGKKLPKLNVKKLEIINYQFIRDDKIVFYKNIKLDLNAKYIVLLTNDFIKDKNKVYHKKKLIKDADAQSFEAINHWFQKDKNKLFHNTIPLELDPKTVNIKKQIYAYDKNFAYFSEHKIKNVDIASFQVLNRNFSKDKFYVYYKEKKLKGVDTSSFQIMGYITFQDKNNIYTIKQGKFVIDRKR